MVKRVAARSQYEEDVMLDAGSTREVDVRPGGPTGVALCLLPAAVRTIVA